MSDVDLLLHGKALLSKIHVITGWTIPSSPELLNILVDQFIKNLTEKFPNLNIDEIEYAFRQHGTTMQDWGKAMNLNLLDAVLIPYINDRFLLSQDEEKVKEKPIDQRIFTQDELDDYARESCEWQYQLFLRGQPIANVESNFDILKKDGVIKDGEMVAELFSRRMEKQILNIYKKQ